MSVIAWWNPCSGIAGDMAMASLIDAGADLEELRRTLRSLPISGWEIEASKVTRGGVSSTLVNVVCEQGPPSRTYSDVIRIVKTGVLPSRVEQRALTVFEKLAVAESRLHGIAPSDVHFHEVGALDAIIDVVGTCAALELLGIDEVRVGKIALGSGTVTCDHGVLPNPAPAVVELLAGFLTYGADRDQELTTPTGAALVAALSSESQKMRSRAMPEMTLLSAGYGAGSRDLPGSANVLQALVGVTEDKTGIAMEMVEVVESTVDDVTGEILSDLLAALLQAGAKDAWVVPVTGKKGRPAHVVTAVGSPSNSEVLVEVIMRHTGSLGVRVHQISRHVADRRMAEVTVDGEIIRIKVGPHRAKAEHDDVLRAANSLGLTPNEVAFRAEAAFKLGSDNSAS